MKKILYIGNKISKHGFNKTTIETLGLSFENEGFKVVYASDKKSFIMRVLHMVFTLFRNAKNTDYVLIDTYSTKAFWYAYFVSQLCRMLELKYIPILHGGNLPVRLKTHPFLGKQLFTNAYKNVAPSNYLKSEFENVGFTNVVYIPNTIALEKYTFKKREYFEPNLLWVRAFATIYNPNMAIHVLKEVQKTYSNATLTMVGPDKDGSLEITKLKAQELTVEVNFTGRLSKEEWTSLAAGYDLFINTTHFDNTPISVIEAMALGLPVISTNVGGIPYLLTDNVNSKLVADNDVMAMTNAIVDLLENSKKANEIAKSARLLVEQFDWEVVKEKWLQLLK